MGRIEDYWSNRNNHRDEWNPMLNSPKSGRSIYKEDIEKDDMPNSRRYHNRHLSDFLKELDITAGHSTGLYFTSPLD